jgi:hypothetical protein
VIPFHDAIALSRKIHIAGQEFTLRSSFAQSNEECLRDSNGWPLFEIDDDLVRKFKDQAECDLLGGPPDWPFKHDAQGNRIRIRTPMQGNVKQHLIRSLLGSAGYDPATRSDVTTTHRGVLHISPAAPGERPGYARPESPVRASALGKLQDLRASRITKPSAPVQVFGRPTPNDPVEQTGDGRDARDGAPRRRVEPDATNSTTLHPGRSITR